MRKPSNKICPRCGKGGYVNYIGQSNLYEAKCYNCGYYFVFGELDLYKEKKPITNADKLRAMSDEELAEFLLNRDLAVVEQAAKAVGFKYKFDRESCLADVVNWLRKDVET